MRQTFNAIGQFRVLPGHHCLEVLNGIFFCHSYKTDFFTSISSTGRPHTTNVEIGTTSSSKYQVSRHQRFHFEYPILKKILLKMSLPSNSVLHPTSPEYADNTIHTLQTVSGENFEIRLKGSLGGDNGVGFSMACVFIAECVSEHSPRYDHPFVVKIFDPRYSSGMREEFKLGEFDFDLLQDFANIVDAGDFDAFAERMATSYEPSDNLSELSKSILGSFHVSPLSIGDIYSQVLADDRVKDAFVTDGVFDEPDALSRETSVWVLSQHMFQHEATLHEYLNQSPEAPVVRLKEVGFIQPKTLATAMPCFGFGATIMELVEGYPMSTLSELCSLSTEAFQQAPAEVRELIPVGKANARRFFENVNHLIQFPSSVGLSSRDPNLGNVICSADPGGNGTKLTWIDVGQFQPLSGRKFTSPKALQYLKGMCLARYAVQANEGFEDDMYDRYSFLFRKVGYSSVIVRDLKLKRFRDWGGKISMTFAWRLIMEDICFDDWDAHTTPVDTRLSVVLIRMAKKIMDREKGMRQLSPKGAREKQDWFQRAVLKLHFLLCSPTGDEFQVTSAATDAVVRFDTIMTAAGYPGSDVVAINCFDDSSLLSTADYPYPSVEEVVKHLSETRIFPERFWSADWSFQRIEAELMYRFEKVFRLKIDYLYKPSTLNMKELANALGKLATEEQDWSQQGRRKTW